MSAATNTNATPTEATLSEEEFTRTADAVAAAALQIEWGHNLSKFDLLSPKMVHSARLCREAVSNGMMRHKLGCNPTTILVKALSHTRTWDQKKRCYVPDQAHISGVVNLRSVHIYLSPDTNNTSEEHRVRRVTTVRTRASRNLERAMREKGEGCSSLKR